MPLIAGFGMLIHTKSRRTSFLGILEGKSSNLAKKETFVGTVSLFLLFLHSFWGICAESTMRGMQIPSLLDYMRIVLHQKKSLLKHKA